MNLFRSMATLVGLALVAAVSVYGVSAQAQSQAGYEISKSQTVQAAPAGWVGRKTTDRETRIGNTPETDGDSLTFVLTIGGFVRKCPTAMGIVAGNFEYSVTGDEVNADNGETKRTHYANHFVATLEGHVKDDSTLDYIEIEGDLTKERDGAARVNQHVPKLRFRPGAGGTPDFDAMLHSVEVTADLSVAVAENFAGPNFLEAFAEWVKKDACVRFAFNPESDTRGLGPNAAATVGTVLQTIEGNVPVAGWLWRASPIEAIGQLAPRDQGRAEGESVAFTYTASSKPKKGNGYTILATSRAGVTDGIWKIAESERFKGTFTQTDATSGAGLALSVSMNMKVDARLVWTPEQGDDRSPPTFGDVRSSFFRATDGEFTVDIGSDNQGLPGSSCEYHGRQTFPVASLPPRALQFLRLEIADDGRYKLTLLVPDQVLNMQAESVCKFPPRRIVRSTLDVNMIAVQIGLREGTLNAEQDIVGQVSPPIQRGPRTITGSWSFARVRE